MERLLKAEQVAEMLQVSKRTIYDWTHAEFIPHYKFPGGVRFKGGEIEQWLKRKHNKGRFSYRVDDGIGIFKELR